MATAKRPKLPKEQYDQLYYYMEDGSFKQVVQGSDPLRYTSPRRYDTLDEARKAALAKSKKEWKVIQSIMSAGASQFLRFHSISFHVFKGRTYVGTVECNILKGKDDGISDHFDGLWYPKGYPKDPSPMLADGKLGAKQIKKAIQKRK